MRKLPLFAAVVFICTPLCADTLYLDNGKAIEGIITVRGADTIIIRTESGIEEVRRQHVVRIISDPVDAPVPASARPVLPSSEQLLKKDAFKPVEYRDWVSQQAKDPDTDKFTAVKVQPTGRRIESVLKLSADLPGDHYAKQSITSSVYSRSVSATVRTTPALSLAGETVGYLNDFAGAGLGIAYQIPRKMKDYTGDFNFLPLYAIAKVRTRPTVSRRYCYLVGHCGYDFFFADKDYKGDTATLSGGLYYGFGAGALFNKINIELMYSVSSGTFRDTGYVYSGGSYYDAKEKIEVQYSKLALTVGVNFQ
jgi:hypothetical protein